MLHKIGQKEVNQKQFSNELNDQQESCYRYECHQRKQGQTVLDDVKVGHSMPD